MEPLKENYVSTEVYVDFEVMAEVDNEHYLVKISKEDLNTLVNFDSSLVIRHWDGEKPVLLLTYGNNSIRTQGDTSEENNLSNLPRIGEDFLHSLEE